MNPIRHLTAIIAALAASCCPSARAQVTFNTTDSAVQAAWDWAEAMARSYVRTAAGDPVGPWFEAALPGRESFCMRDLSHQAGGALVLGLDAECFNMFTVIASECSQARDWCSWWETDRRRRPTACDYASDKEFWYNLPANFDVVRACRAAWEWTGDRRYLDSDTLRDFYRHTVHDYAPRWMLTPDSILHRRRYLNSPEPFDPRNAFHTCRGLPSYAENFGGIISAVDLTGAALAGFRAYAALTPDTAEARWASGQAAAYAALLDSVWWDPAAGRFNTYLTADGAMHRGEGVPYLLLVGAAGDSVRAEASIADILSRQWNVENLSAFPLILYRHGHAAEARRLLTALPEMKRSDYPEVSYGVVEAVAAGLAGIEPSASRGTLATHYRGGDDATVTLAGLPLLGGTVTVTHHGRRSTTLTNLTPLTLLWEAAFDSPGHSGHPEHSERLSAPPLRRTAAVPPGTTLTLAR